MAKPFGQEMRELVGELMDEFEAEEMQYTQNTPGTYDPVTGKSNAKASKKTLRGLVDVITREQTTLGDIVHGDLAVDVSPAELDFTPQLNDELIRGGQKYTVVAIMSDMYNAALTLHVRLA